MMQLFLSRADFTPRRKFLNTLRASWFPGSLGSGFMSLAVVVGHMDVTFGYVVGILGTLIGGVLLFDAAARLSDYLYYSSTTKAIEALRILAAFRKSFCSRQVGIALYGDVARKFYRSLGYRWYHVLPDGALSRKSVFFRWSFWKSVFGS